ncbi:MAG: MogA/MoaB family molybdenum cofactor biosynthesis protein [Chloroflexota bacterium]
MPVRAGILTVSDSVSAGTSEDRSGSAILRNFPDTWEVVGTAVVPDDQRTIEDVLRAWADDDHLDAIFTTGGTGLGPRDVTPEATLALAEKTIPGIAEALRAEGLKQAPGSMLSRGVAALRGTTLIINLPGSPAGAGQGAALLCPLIEHAIATMHGARH